MSKNADKKIVIVDDDQEICASLQVILSDAGYQVESINAVNFVQVVAEKKPDLIMLDVWFGEDRHGLILKKAIELTGLIKSPIIMMSSDTKLPQYAQQYKLKHYLNKPIDISLMLDMVNKVIA